MPVTLTETRAPLEPPRKLWTQAALSALEADGLLAGQHLELIQGDLINKMGKKWPHVSAVTLLKARLQGVFGTSFVVQEAPIDIALEDNSTNEPEPDIIVLKRELGTFASAGPPRPGDLHLVVEVSGTTLHFGLTVKAPLAAPDAQLEPSSALLF